MQFVMFPFLWLSAFPAGRTSPGRRVWQNLALGRTDWNGSPQHWHTSWYGSPGTISPSAIFCLRSFWRRYFSWSRMRFWRRFSSAASSSSVGFGHGHFKLPDEIQINLNFLHPLPGASVRGMNQNFLHKFMDHKGGQLGEIRIFLCQRQKVAGTVGILVKLSNCACSDASSCSSSACSFSYSAHSSSNRFSSNLPMA